MKTKGFTLVELLVVIAILAILATVSVVGYTSYINSANESLAIQEMTQVKSALLAEDIVNDNFSIGTSVVTTDDDANADHDTLAAFLDALDDNLNGTVKLADDGKSFTYTLTGKDITVSWDIATGKVAVAE